MAGRPDPSQMKLENIDLEKQHISRCHRAICPYADTTAFKPSAEESVSTLLALGLGATSTLDMANLTAKLT